MQRRLDMLTDHSIGQYAQHLVSAVEKEMSSGGTNGAAVPAHHFAILEKHTDEKCRGAATR